MPDATYIACPRCGEPYAMTAMQKRLFHGRTLTCQRCAKPFQVTEETPDPVPAPAVRAWAPPQPAEPQPAEPVPAKPVPPPRRKGEGLTAGRMAALILFVAGAVAFLLYATIAPSVHRSREAARRVTCTSNLGQIGLALQLYANTNRGQFPDSLEVLVANGSVPPEMLVCPSSRDTPATGQTPAEQAADLLKGKHLSYVYAGKGLSFSVTKQVLAYEPLEQHDGEGVNVLFTDGTAQFLPRAAAIAAIPQLAPPGTTTAPSATQPATTAPSVPGR